MNSKITIENVTEEANNYKRGVVRYSSHGIETELFFNNAVVEQRFNNGKIVGEIVRFEQINNDTEITFAKEDISSVVRNAESTDPMFHITLNDGTRINVFYLNPDFKEYDISNKEGDILPCDLVSMLEEANDIVIGIYGNNLEIEKKSYKPDEVYMEENDEGYWELKAGAINLTLYDDSCNQIHCINHSPMVKQYVIKPSYMPFIEVHIGLLMK